MVDKALVLRKLAELEEYLGQIATSLINGIEIRWLNWL